MTLIRLSGYMGDIDDKASACHQEAIINIAAGRLFVCDICGTHTLTPVGFGWAFDTDGGIKSPWRCAACLVTIDEADKEAKP